MDSFPVGKSKERGKKREKERERVIGGADIVNCKFTHSFMAFICVCVRGGIVMVGGLLHSTGIRSLWYVF